MSLDLIRVAKEVVFSNKYLSVEESAGGRVVFKTSLGAPANLLVVLAEEDSTIKINNGNNIPMKRDEAIVMINVLQANDLYVVNGKVKVFATIIPKWMPALFWTRSVTVLGVADAVQDALTNYGAAKDSTLSSVLPRYLTDSGGNELSDYIRSVWRPDVKLYNVTVPSGEVWNVAGNMVKSVDGLTVQGTLVVSDQALLRVWGGLTVDGGSLVVQDNAEVVSEVIA